MFCYAKELSEVVLAMTRAMDKPHGLHVSSELVILGCLRFCNRFPANVSLFSGDNYGGVPG